MKIRAAANRVIRGCLLRLNKLNKKLCRMSDNLVKLYYTLGNIG